MDGFVAGSLRQAIFEKDGMCCIVDGPDAEPRLAWANEIYLFRHTAFEIRPAHPEGRPVPIGVLRDLLREEIAFFEGLDGLLVGMDPDMPECVRSRSITRAERILESAPELASRIRQRFLRPVTEDEWEPRSGLKLAEGRGALSAASCYRQLCEGFFDRICHDIDDVVRKEFGSGVEAQKNRDTLLRSGIVAELVRIEAEGDVAAARNLIFQGTGYPGMESFVRGRHVLMALQKAVLSRLESESAPNPVGASTDQDGSTAAVEYDPLVVAVDAAIARVPRYPAKGAAEWADVAAIQRQIEWIGRRLERGEVAGAELDTRQLIERQAGRSQPEHIVKTLTGIADLARQHEHAELAWRLMGAIEATGYEDAASCCLRGNLLRSLGRLEEALASFDDTVERFPEDVVARNARAETLRELGRLEEALASFDDTVERCPGNVVARNARAETLRELGRLEEALASFDDTVERFPEDVVVRTARAETLRELGRLEEALASFDDTVERFPGNVVARNARAETLRELGRLEEALASLEDTVERFPGNVVARTARAETLRELGRLEEALASFDDTVERFPGNVVARTARAETLRELGRLEEALASFDDTVERFPEDVVARNARAETLRELGRLEEALASFDDTVERFPGNVVARTARAETLRELGRLEEALASFDDTVERFPGNVVARNARAETLRELGRLEEALASFDDTVERFPEDVVARTARAETLRELGRLEEALASFDDTVERFPGNVVARNARAETLRELGRLEEALASFDDTVERFPEDVVARTARAETLRELGRLEEALASFDDTVERFPGNVVARTARAETLRELGRLEEALASLEDTARRFPENFVARNAWAHLLGRLGHFDRAEALLKAAATKPRARRDWIAAHILAIARLRIGRIEEALEGLNQGIRECPFADVRKYFRTARLVAWLAGQHVSDAVEEFAAFERDRTISGIQAANVVLLHVHAHAKSGNRVEAQRRLVEGATVINFDSVRKRLAAVLQQRYGLGEAEPVQGVLAARLDEEIIELEIDLASPLRLVA